MLQNLKFSFKTSRQRLALLLLDVLLPYLFEKILDKVQRFDWGNPSNKRSASKLKRLRYWIDFFLRFVAKLA